MTLDERLKEIEWLADDSGSYTEEAYRSMPGKIKSLLAALRLALEQRDTYFEGQHHGLGYTRNEDNAAILKALNGEGKE